MPGGPPSMPPTKAEAPVTSAPLPECPTAAFMPFTVARCLSSAITSSVRIGISPSPSPAKGVLVTSWPLQLRLNLAAKWIWVEQPQVLKYKQEMLSLSILGKLSLTVIAEGYWNCQRDLRLDQKKNGFMTNSEILQDQILQYTAFEQFPCVFSITHSSGKKRFSLYHN